MKFKISCIIILLFLGCSQSTDTETDPLPVVVKITVLHYDISGTISYPTDSAIVDIVSSNEQPLPGYNSLEGITDENGVAVIETDINTLLPKHTYTARAFYVLTKKQLQTFTVPQYPNDGNRYLMNVEVYHIPGDQPSSVPKVRMTFTVTEYDSASAAYVLSAGAKVSLYRPDGYTTPAPDNFVYTSLTGTDGKAYFYITSDYFLKGNSYIAKVEKSGFKPAVISFAVPVDTNGDGDLIVNGQTQLDCQ